eukprot:gene2742-3559_t
MFASGMMQGSLYGYLNSSEQIIADVFQARNLFPLVFAFVATGIAIANFSNAAIVERFGARRVSQCAVFAFMATASIQILVALSGGETLWMFTALMMVNVGLIGFIGSNFGSIAMEDFGHMAGVASSYQSFAKTLLAATLRREAGDDPALAGRIPAFEHDDAALAVGDMRRLDAFEPPLQRGEILAIIAIIFGTGFEVGQVDGHRATLARSMRDHQAPRSERLLLPGHIGLSRVPVGKRAAMAVDTRQPLADVAVFRPQALRLPVPVDRGGEIASRLG